MSKLVLLRHGESEWNQKNLFCGWHDADLSATGITEAKHSGQLLKAENIEFKVVYTSYLKRAIRTMWLALEEMDRMWLPVEKRWQLNERHYGALQGLNKKQTTEKYGEDQVKIWRRSYSTPPPPLDPKDPTHPRNDLKYKDIPEDQLPSSEALKNCLERVLPCWNSEIAPILKAGQNVLIVAHGNSLRALIKHLDGIPDDEITELNVPTGIPLLYDLDVGRSGELKPTGHHYLGDPELAKQATEKVANQTKQ